MNRALELAAATVAFVITAPVVLLIMVAVKADSPGPAILSQLRVGQSERLFRCHKIRTMHVGTATLPTHMVGAAQITRLGGFLRRTKLDELPQLLNIIRGEMSIVGPRPCLPTQTELIEERRRRGVFRVRPGLTGLAQVQNVDMSDPPRLAEVDAIYLGTRSFRNDLRIIYRTFTRGGHHGASQREGALAKQRSPDE